MTKSERLAKALSEAIGEPVFARFLHGSTGYYRHIVADCQPWTGHTGTMEAGGMGNSISCWDTMTDCLRFGFLVTIDRGMGSYGYYNVSALDPDKISKVPTEGMVWIPPRKRKAAQDASTSTCGIANGDEPKTLRAKDSSQ